MRKKLSIVSFLPIILLFLLSAGSLAFFAKNYLTATSYAGQIQKSDAILQALKALGDERTAAALYFHGSISLQEYKKSFAKTDEAIQRIKSLFGDYASLISNLAIIQIARNKTEQKSDSFKNIIYGLYTNAATHALLELLDEIAQKSPNIPASQMQILYNAIAQSIEYGSIEQMFVATHLVKGRPLSQEAKGIWLSYIPKADIVLNAVILDELAKKRAQAIRYNDDLIDVYEQLRTLRIKIAQNELVPQQMWVDINKEKAAILFAQSKGVREELLGVVHAHQKLQIAAMALFATLLVASIILFILAYLFAKDLTLIIQKLEGIFKKVALDEEDRRLVESINFDSLKGIHSAYEVLDKALARIEEAREAAEEANKAKSMFLANMSHEIRTPLNGIMGFTELLKNTELNEDQKEFVSIIEKSSQNLLEIINHILDIAKIESNKIELESVVFEPIEEFENAVEVYAAKAAEKGIDLALFVDPALEKPLKGDPTKIKEVLINLISNAIKFTDKGGEVVVEIRKKGQKGPNAIVHFEVRDTGIGIPKEKQEKIFEAFSQADISVTRKYGGTGLGLTISREFIKLMGGELKFESEEGRGSRFYFTLELEEIPVAHESFKDKFHGIKIIFYEDPAHPKTQNRFLKEYFDFFGAQFAVVRDIKELFDQAPKYNFSLLDYDYVQEQQIKNLHIKKVPIALISKVSYKKRIEEILGKIIKNIYEPANFTKLKQLLQFYVQNTPAIKSKASILASSQNIRFKAKALVAEDNSINQKLIKKTLEDLGLEVDIADNGLEAIEMFKNNDYDIVFMDIQMPVKDGIEAMQEIHLYEREMHKIPTPIIALTAHALKGDRERFMQKGFDEYITKPINRSDIITILKAFLPDKIYYPDEEEIIEAEVEEEKKEQPEYDYDILLLKKSLLESKLFANVLKSLGYTVDIAFDANDMVSRFEKRRYRILFVDKDSEHYNFHLLKKLKERYKDTKFVLLVEPEYDLNNLTTIEKEFFDDIIKNIIKKDFFQQEIERLIGKKE